MATDRQHSKERNLLPHLLQLVVRELMLKAFGEFGDPSLRAVDVDLGSHDGQ